MAEAPPRPCRFFCHRCSEEISPRLPIEGPNCSFKGFKRYQTRNKGLIGHFRYAYAECPTPSLFNLRKKRNCRRVRSDYICPRCESGFIEELPGDGSAENGSTSTASNDQNRPSFENVDQHMFTFPHGYGQFALGIFDEGFEFRAGLPGEDNRDAENRREREMASRQRYGARQPRGRHLPRRQGTRHEGVPTLEGIIQQLVNGIIAPTAMPNMAMGPWGMLHSNPMDYAWGANGLDAIITQLLNQFENTGPPPADKEKIKSLPTVQIKQEHVGAGLECPVCKEDYSAGENHDTCPVCRKSLSGQNTATDPPGLSGMNFSPSSSSSSSSSSPSNENASNNS
ncbi:E3 ubiquitin-protein ligase RNF126 [Anabarilius grahami]|uniref:E3 ubiquitin-protein ligase RNF126 n=1 Tax=Anabarilius grahami TaxID=495550 RepID=A0A3N0Z0A3_ANAGA|nr:E3 ubiquitin-protein ligase RNF126 [Anabarilius grahami]